MKTTIAAAVLAVIGTSAPAALYNYEYDINYTFDGGSLVNFCSDLQTVCEREVYPGLNEVETGSLSLVLSSARGVQGSWNTDSSNFPIRGELRSERVDDRGVGQVSFGDYFINTLTEFTFDEDGTGSISMTSGDKILGMGGFNEVRNYTIIDFTVTGAPEPLPDPELAPVPLPASGIILLAGLGGLGIWRRKQA